MLHDTVMQHIRSDGEGHRVADAKESNPRPAECSLPLGVLLPQSQMRAIVVIIANVIRQKSLQVSLVDSDDVIEKIAAAASHPALGHSVLPRTPDRGSHAGDLQ